MPAITAPVTSPFNAYGGTSPLVPAIWDVSVAGRAFMLDPKFFGTPQMTRSSVTLLKPQQAIGPVNEHTLNPADGARAAVESWHHGAGQQWLDRDDSDAFRFRESKGVDVWTRGRLSLLPATEQKLTIAADTYNRLVAAGGRLYFAESFSVVFTSDITPSSPTWTSVTGLGAGTVTGIASDGYRVWIVVGTGIYDTNTGTAAAASRTTGLTGGGVLGYVKGRLMLSDGAAIYNITSLTGAAAGIPAALFTHPNSTFQWVGFAEGRNNIYAAGYLGDKSSIYRTAVSSDGTTLTAPVVAGTLPDGEVIYAIDSYLDLILIGSTSGWWVAAQDSNGDLTINKVQDTNHPVRCFEGQGDFVWYGWTNFDAHATGLGRADLRADTKGASVLTPAYASDLMAVYSDLSFSTASVVSVVTFDGIRVFLVAGIGSGGVWAEQISSDALAARNGGGLFVSGGSSGGTSTGPGASRVSSGYLYSGNISHGIPDDKAALTVTVATEALVGSVAVSLVADEVSTELGVDSTADSTSVVLSAGSRKAKHFETQLTLSRSADDETVGPAVTRVTLESNLAPGRGEFINAAFLFRERLSVNGQDVAFDCGDAYRYLVGLESSGISFPYQDVLGVETVTLDDHDLIEESFTSKRDGYQGTFIAKFRRGRRRT